MKGKKETHKLYYMSGIFTYAISFNPNNKPIGYLFL